jgi:SHS2 domain-containing protein
MSSSLIKISLIHSPSFYPHPDYGASEKKYDHHFDMVGKIRYTHITVKELEAGYQEIEHTADWELHVWAPDIFKLLSISAVGMYALSQTTLMETPKVEREFEIKFQDRESMIVDFLTELLFFEEDEGLAFNSFQITKAEDVFKFVVTGAPIKEHGKEIKAVTYHGLKVNETARGLEVSIVFDV